MPDAVLDVLRAAPRYLNPAIALSLQLEAEGVYNPEDVFRYEGRIQHAIAEAEQAIKEVERAARVLQHAPPQPATTPPLGF